MIVAIIIGFACGLCGFLPLIFGTKLARKATATSNLGMAGSLLLGVLLSLLLLAGGVILCIVISRDNAFPFVIAEAVGLCGFAITYGVMRLVRKEKG